MVTDIARENLLNLLGVHCWSICTYNNTFLILLIILISSENSMNEAIFYVWGKKRKALCWKLAVESREIAARLFWWGFIPTYTASLTSVGLAASEKELTSHEHFVFKKPQEVFLSSLMMIGILILVSTSSINVLSLKMVKVEIFVYLFCIQWWVTWICAS